MGNIARARIANRARAGSSSASTATASPTRARAGRTSSTRRYAAGGPTTSTPRASARPRIVQQEQLRALGFPDRGLQERSDFTGFNWADVPVILVEMGFMTNRTDDRLLATAAYQRRAAIGLCRGTLRFLGRSPARCG